MEVRERDVMGGLAKGLKVIEAFTAEHPRLSISEAAEITGLDRATTRRCLLTLSELGYAAYDGKYFTVTPRILRLGTGCLATMPLPRIVQPILDMLSEEIGQSTSVSILDEEEIVYVARAAHRKVMSITLMPGSRLPCYCTSMGKVLLSTLPEAQARAVLQKTELIARTPNTLVAVDDLLKELRATRERGYGTSDQEVELGLRSVAVPVISAHNKVLAAINVGLAASAETMNDVIKRYVPPLLRVQNELRKILI
ncbi:IclR family transcriptional regulator domain-containing protein [Phyllobacterium sp. SL163]|nr:helix-turn-helix domain-containing protein [Phyllobacterium sp.]